MCVFVFVTRMSQKVVKGFMHSFDPLAVLMGKGREGKGKGKGRGWKGR